MKGIFKNYKSFIILISSIIFGGILGFIFKDKILFLKPFGDLFLNMLLVIIVPLIFFSISTSIGRANKKGRVGKLLLSIFGVMIVTSLVSVIVGVFVTKSFVLVEVDDRNKIIEGLDDYDSDAGSEVKYLEKIVSTISVDDFASLFSRSNMIALVVFSIIFGVGVSISGDKGKKCLDMLDSCNSVILNIIKIIMYYAPIGLGCYMAVLTGNYGTDIAFGYTNTFVIYTFTSVLFFIVIYSLYAYIGGGKNGLKLFWKNVFPSTLTALATCSSAASMPVNIDCTKKMEVSEDVANTNIAIGTNFHKDGSIIGSAFKIMFLVYLFSANVGTFEIILVALVATLLVSAVPIGGGTISEMMILTMLGFPVIALPILSIIATIIDAPATVLNVVGNSASSILVNKIVK